jgi:4,5-dihydroxyphthalate decarboxylase
MVDIPITVACGNYDRTRPIMDGRVRVEGCAVTYLPLYPEEIFFRAFRYHEFDVCELSLSSYILAPIAGLDLQPIDQTKTLVGMLRDGELDALFTARAPSSFLRGEPHIARLFPNTREAELAYFKKTGLFPIMHLIGIRNTLLAQYPWLATSVYKAFCEAKALAMTDLCDVNALMVTLPFLEAETRETMAAMGTDFWRYGVHENTREIEALTTYAHEQGLVDRKLTAAELFAPSVFELSKV